MVVAAVVSNNNAPLLTIVEPAAMFKLPVAALLPTCTVPALMFNAVLIVAVSLNNKVPAPDLVTAPPFCIP